MSLDGVQANIHFFFIRYLGTEKLKEIFGETFDSELARESALDAQLDKNYASELAFYGVEDVGGTSPIPALSGVEKPERDLPYGFLAETHRNFIRIFLMQQTRVYMSKKSKSKLKDVSKALEFLPNEVFFEVFSYLRPIDLYNLCIAGQPFRRYLVEGTTSESTWRKAYVLEDLETDPHTANPIPLPPKQISGFCWAHLLFGPSTCSAPPLGFSQCNRRGAVVDFTHCHRVCRSCWQEYYTLKDKITVDDPDNFIWDVIPTSCRRLGGRVSVFYSLDEYYIPEIRRMEHRLAMKKAELSEDKYRLYVQSLKAEARERAQCAERYQAWTDNMIEDASNYINRLTRKSNAQVIKKIVKLGYTQEEASSASLELLLMRNDRRFIMYKLTPRVWRKFGPMLLRRAEVARVEAHWGKLILGINEEKDLVNQLWTRFQHTQKVSTWEHLPPVEHIMGLKPIHSLMVDGIIRRLKGDQAGTEDKYEKYFDQLPDLITRWQNGLYSHYNGIIPRSACRIPRNSDSWSDLEFLEAMFSRATCVFECMNCPTERNGTPWQPGRVLIGWKAFNGHLACPFRSWRDKLEYSYVGATAASALVTLAGLDPQTALETDVDALDYRFTCANCSIGPTGRRGYRGHKAWTWRECVYHFIQMNRNEQINHEIPKWNRLSPEMSAYIKRREVPGYAFDLSWSCLHCPPGTWLDDTRSRTIRHVITSHGIRIPKAEVDYKHTMRGPSSPRMAIGLSEYPTPEQYSCLRCERPESRLYAHRSIISHLLDKHGIRDTEEGREYVCIPLYDAHFTSP
ncbi:hypothetical protein BDN72DRAFT_963601 [Pluteus cervinus]|uniref:Uncharacterized protein n=1 Tax=Pluteus cervinus TaxID=181527 RepID=A0ACD3AF29_9AGAR|nr:hypothetical protein BDN72DRAFT_963601 [Pluteus cervinus]